MEFILECNVTDLNSLDIDGKTSLYLAAENDHEDLVSLLLVQAQIDVNKGIESGKNGRNLSSLYGIKSQPYKNCGVTD